MTGVRAVCSCAPAGREKKIPQLAATHKESKTGSPCEDFIGKVLGRRIRIGYFCGLAQTMSYLLSNVTNIRQAPFDWQVNQCMALPGIMAKPPGPRI